MLRQNKKAPRAGGVKPSRTRRFRSHLERAVILLRAALTATAALASAAIARLPGRAARVVAADVPGAICIPAAIADDGRSAATQLTGLAVGVGAAGMIGSSRLGVLGACCSLQDDRKRGRWHTEEATYFLRSGALHFY